MRTAASSLLVGSFLLVSLVVSVPTSAQTELPPNVQSESPERGRDGRKTWIVYPVNQSPDDANAIQQAIDAAKAGDRIVLGAGVFNFGDFDNIRVAKDLTLEGAWNSRDKVPLTTIRGGLNAFLIGRKTPIPKPEFITVNGRQVMHITQDLYGKFHFPFMYTPYFDQATGKPTGVHYNIYDDWVVVNVDVRQITFDRQYGASMFISGVKGGTIERNRFISGWPNQIGIEGLEPLGGQIAFFNMASRPYLPLSYGLCMTRPCWSAVNSCEASCLSKTTSSMVTSSSFRRVLRTIAGMCLLYRMQTTQPRPAVTTTTTSCRMCPRTVWPSTSTRRNRRRCTGCARATPPAGSPTHPRQECGPGAGCRLAHIPCSRRLS